MLGRDWEPAEATIVAVQFVATGFSPSGSRSEFVADVRPEGGAPAFRGIVKGPRNSRSFHDPEVGQVVRVEYHPKSGEIKFDHSDPGLRRDAAAERAQERFDAIAAGAPGSAVPPEAAPPPEPSPLADISAAMARVSAASTDLAETLAAIKRARAAGDLEEVERLKAEYQRRSDGHRGGGRGSAPGA